MAGTENLADFKEVTPQERAQLEKLRDEWKRPPQSFIDQWNEACVATWAHGSVFSKRVGQYNENTGYFELNGILNITTEQALVIMARYLSKSNLQNARTNLPFSKALSLKISDLLTNTDKVEVLWGVPTSEASSYITYDYVQNSLFREMRYFAITSFQTFQFQNASNFEIIKDIYITAKGTMYIHHSPKLTLESMQTLVVANPDGNTIRIHKDIYAALTGEATYPFNGGEKEDWLNLLSDAATKNITFTT